MLASWPGGGGRSRTRRPARGFGLPAAAKLTDSGGRAVAWQDLRGKPRVVTMFYTSCRYVCPLVVDSLRAVERGLTAKRAQRRRLRADQHGPGTGYA